MTETALMTESDCAKAADAWIDAEEGRRDRYGVAEATSPVVDGMCIITTTNFRMLDVDAASGKVTYKGVSPARPAKLQLTSRAKMGRARKARTGAARNASTSTAAAKEAADALRKTKAAKVSGPDWTRCTRVDAKKAQAYCDLLTAGTTAHAAGEATGLDAKARCRVEQEMTRVGYTMQRTLNPDRAKGNRLTVFLYTMTPPEVST